MNKDNIQDVYPMSDIQRGMVYTTLKNPGKAIYHDQFVFYVPLITDFKRFKKALELMVEVHPILRTSFDLESYNEQIQILHKKLEPILSMEDLTALTKSKQEDYIRDYMLEQRYLEYDFSKAPLWRINLFNINSENTIYLIQFHHSILDGWSMASFNTQLFNIYKKLETDADYTPEKLKFSIKDTIMEEISEKENPETIAYWKNKLDDYNRLNIFSSKPTFVSHRQEFDLKTTNRLRAFSVENQLGYRSIIFGAFVYVLKMLSFESDFVLGIVSNTRPPIEDSEKLLGCFLNTLPMRVSLDNYEKLNWTEYFKGIENEMKILKTKDRSTLYEISKIVGGNKKNENPFFDIIYNYIDFYNIYKKLDISASNVKHFKKNKEANLKSFEVTNTFLDINIIDIFNGPIGFHLKLTREFEFGYSANTICNYVEKIILNYLDDPESKIKDTILLSDEEQQQIASFNLTEITYPTNLSILDLLDAQVKENPSAIAASYDNDKITYQQLEEQSNQIAHYLVKKYHIEKGDLIGMQLDRAINMLSGILGIMKAGAAYVPLDMQYPKERIEYIQKDSQYKVCVNNDFFTHFEAEKETIDKSSLKLKVSTTDLAYGIYTSGSTGNPKGVLNAHSGLYNRLLWMRDDLQITADDIILQKTPYTFDVSVWELLMPSITGCKLVFAKPDGHKDPAYLQDLIRESQVSIIHFVPSMLGIFLEDLNPKNCKSLRHVVCSGEALPSNMVEEFKSKIPWARIHNLYGPTEAAIDVTSIDLTNVNTLELGVSIGKPVANTKIYIVDKNLRQQPVGIPGELLIEGIQVAEGYLNRPDLNAEKFIPSPFVKGERIYKTGDLARWLPNGEIAYMGRLDHQVKIRGNRIELGEIETKIQASTYVDNVVVIVKGTETRKYLVAYIIPKENYTEEVLYNYLETHLPDYMVPSRIVTMQEFPLTSSGKINRKRLPELDEEEAVSTQYIAPRNEMEETLVTIWEEVLEFKNIGVQDNFLRIGGDSILSIRLISKINKKFEVNLTIAQIYEFNTIEKLCKQIEENKVSAESNQKIRDDIRMSFSSLMDEI